MFAVLSDPAIYEYENEPPPSLEWLRARFARLESRVSADGREQWLNWVIRILPSALAYLPGASASAVLIGYVQATVRADHRAAIAYELASAYWGRGLARRAVDAMIGELVQHYRVRLLTAVLKRDNLRSRRFLERLEFAPGVPAILGVGAIEPDEVLMYREIAKKPQQPGDDLEK